MSNNMESRIAPDIPSPGQNHPQDSVWSHFSASVTAAHAADAVVVAQTSTAKTPHITLDSNPGWAKGLPTPVYEWQDPNVKQRGTVLMLHAFPMHGKSFDPLARELASKGFTCVAPDMLGFGRTSNQRVSYDTTCDSDMLAVATRMRKQFPDLPLVALGESMGGSFAIRLAANPQAGVDKLIVSGPGLKVEKYQANKADMIRQGIHNIFGHQPMNFSAHIVNHYAKDPAIARAALRDPLVRKTFDLDELLECPKIARQTKQFIDYIPPKVPVLMLQAMDDEMCSPVGIDIMQRRLHSRLEVDEFYGGHVMLEGPVLRDDVKHSVDKWLDSNVPKSKKGM